MSVWEMYLFCVEGLRPIPKWTAEALARGRDKSQQSLVMMRRRAAVAAKRLREQRVSGRELYRRVADELGSPERPVGTTTAYYYLRAAGVLGKGKRR